MGCLDEVTLDDLVSGRLSGESLRVAEAHLDVCRSCSEVVSVLAGGVPGASDEELEPGTRIGRYVVSKRLGRGAMGVVYVAADPELHRDVALKIIRHGAGADDSERMLREAQTLARLAHPNVVAIHDVGRARGSVYFAMELVKGKSLREGLPETSIITNGLDVLAQAGAGLVAAHQAGIIHRDFKPENVMVGDDRRVRVTDFGLAHADGAVPDADASNLFSMGSVLVTKTGGIVGTPAYMAPELLRGGKASELSDQFAFGVTMFEVLTGTRPFAARSIEQLRAVVERGPDRAGLERCPKRLRPVLSRALESDPSARYPNMVALLADLALRAQPRRTWISLASGFVLFALGFAALLMLRSYLNRDPCSESVAKIDAVWNDQRSKAIYRSFAGTGGEDSATSVVRALDHWARNFRAEQRSACEATHVRHDQSPAVLDARTRCLDRKLAGFSALTETLANADSAIVRGAVEAVSDLPNPDECSEVESIAAMDPRPTDATRVRELDALGRELSALVAVAGTGRYRESLPRAKEIAEQTTKLGWRPLIADAELFVATLLRKTGEYEEAGKRARTALTAAEASHADRTAASAWLEVLAIDGERGEPLRVVENTSLASAALARIGDPPDLRAALLGQVGVAHTEIGDLYAAQRELDRALAMATELHGENELFVSRMLSALGNLARARGLYEMALVRHQKALTMDSELLGPRHPALAVHYHNIAGVLRLLRRHPAALESYKKALSIEESALGANHPSVALTENSIAILLIETNDVPGARHNLEAALAILEPRHHPDRALVLSNLGIADASENQHRAAVGHFDEAIAVVVQSLGANHLRLAGILREKSKSERALGKSDDADRDLQEARRIAGLHAKESLEAASLKKELDEDAARPKKRSRSSSPKRIAPVLGSTTYGAATNWDHR